MDDAIVYKSDTGNEILFERVKADNIYNIAIKDKSGDIVGRAIITEHIKGDKAIIILFDIAITEEKNRGKGYGSELMAFITSVFDKITTGKSTDGGKRLCKKFGFRDVGDFLIFDKGEHDA